MVFRIFLIACLVLCQQECEGFLFNGECLETAARVWNAFLNFFDAKIFLMERTMTTFIELLQSAILNGTDIFTVMMDELQRDTNRGMSTPEPTSTTAMPAGQPPPEGVQPGRPGGMQAPPRT